MQQSSVPWGVAVFCSTVLRGYSGVQATAGDELAHHFRLDWFDSMHDIGQYAIDDVLMKDAQVTVSQKVVLK